MEYLLGIDLGTSSLKAVIIDEHSDVFISTSVPYITKDIENTASGFIERDFEEFWIAIKQVVSFYIQDQNINPSQVRCIALSVLGGAFAPLDSNFKPLRKAIIGLDMRAVKESEFIKKEFGNDRIHAFTGQPEIAFWPAAKLLWIKNNEPEIFRSTRYIASVEDYLIYKLTGKFISERSICSETLYFDIVNDRWWLDMLNFIGIDRNYLPEVKNSGEIVGNISIVASKETGLSTETIIATGAMDVVAGAIGTGNITSSIVTEITGTVLAIGTTHRGILSKIPPEIPVNCHAFPNTFFLMPWCASGGAVLKWFNDEFFDDAKQKSTYEKSYDLMTRIASSIAPGSDGLLLLPYIVGGICPESSSEAKGVFFGIKISHTRAHFVRAILEAIGYVLNEKIELLRQIGLNMKEIRVVGGGSKSDLWNQIKADITGIPIATMTIKEACSLGVALLAGVAVGVYSSLEDAANSKFVSIEKITRPIKENRIIYNKCFMKYRELYKSIKHLF